MKPGFFVRLAVVAVTLAVLTGQAQTLEKLPPVYVVPNFHPASCGWLVNWSVERNYCANSYLSHLNRVRDDTNYRFVLSECNNMIAIQNFAPERFAELKERVREGRVELVNAFFLEPTVNLSGGEALAKMGIEGLRWQQQVMGARPRACWAIDICGIHEQLAQLCDQLGLGGLVYTRNYLMHKTIYWSQSPDGSRTPTFDPGHYSDGLSSFLYGKDRLTTEQLQALSGNLAKRTSVTPSNAPMLILAGVGDYSLAPQRKESPSEFLHQWEQFQPANPIYVSTFSNFLDAVHPERLHLDTFRGGAPYGWSAFWIQCPRVKGCYRRDEHALASAEMLATIASLKAGYEYPVQVLYHGWLQMLLNMDRNTLWGAAGGMVFEDANSWDAKDRFEWVEKHAFQVSDQAAHKISGDGGKLAMFNPLNWERHDPVNGEYEASLPSVGFGTRPKTSKTSDVTLPTTIRTKYYLARINPTNGALVSLKLESTGRELLGGPANVLVAEQGLTGGGESGDNVVPRDQRPRLGSSSDTPCAIRVTENSVALTVEATGSFYGGAPCKRVIRFNKNYPRIDFETELNDVPDKTVVLAEFPLAESPTEIRRGIPFGFSEGAWGRTNSELAGVTKGILPAIQWSDYALPSGGGVALLDRGLPGREITGHTPVIFLLNAVDKYYGIPNSWLSGKGQHRLAYALVVHEADWNKARIPRMAWEFNCPPIAVPNCAQVKSPSFLTTSDNVIVEAMRRDGADIEVRLNECLGLGGEANIRLNLPCQHASLTDLTGGRAQDLAGGPTYKFAVRPQQIVTLRFRTASPVANIKPLLDWTELVPENKLAALHRYLPNAVGFPKRDN